MLAEAKIWWYSVLQWRIYSGGKLRKKKNREREKMKGGWGARVCEEEEEKASHNFTKIPLIPYFCFKLAQYLIPLV